MQEPICSTIAVSTASLVECGRKYPSKLEFDSTHSRVVDLDSAGIPCARSRVRHRRGRRRPEGQGLLGRGMRYRARSVHACVREIRSSPILTRASRISTMRSSITSRAGRDRASPLSGGFPRPAARHSRPSANAKVVLTTANIGFAVMRLLFLLGRFEYGKRGILDLTHTRLFTFATLKRAMRAAGFEVTASEGVVMPLPFVLGTSGFSRLLMRLNQWLVRVHPALFGFQILIRANARPSAHHPAHECQAGGGRKIVVDTATDRPGGVNVHLLAFLDRSRVG